MLGDRTVVTTDMGIAVRCVDHLMCIYIVWLIVEPS